MHVISYADDFIITGKTKEVLIQKVMPVVQEFLKERGLSLSKEKSKITHVSEGFDFLGFTIRKFDKIISKPSKASVKRLLANLRHTVTPRAIWHHPSHFECVLYKTLRHQIFSFA